MFTAKQIRDEHCKVKTGADYPRYIQTLKGMGITHYEFIVANGLNTYYGNQHQVTDEPKYKHLFIADKSSKDALTHAIAIHQQGQTDFKTFCQMAAAAGVEKWIADLSKMVVLYLDKKGGALLAEPIPVGEYTPLP
jgi:uncharacterized protein YbcV (DUF1398 family)